MGTLPLLHYFIGLHSSLFGQCNFQKGCPKVSDFLHGNGQFWRHYVGHVASIILVGDCGGRKLRWRRWGLVREGEDVGVTVCGESTNMGVFFSHFVDASWRASRRVPRGTGRTTRLHRWRAVPFPSESGPPVAAKEAGRGGIVGTREEWK